LACHCYHWNPDRWVANDFLEFGAAYATLLEIRIGFIVPIDIKPFHVFILYNIGDVVKYEN
jgi:hypothetical protein